MTQHDSASALRQRYAEVFPGWSQQLITWLTGKALPGQRAPRVLAPPLLNVLLTIAQWPLAVAAGFAAYRLGVLWGVLATPLVWLVSLNSLRRLQVVAAHHAVHREVVRSRRGNYLLQAVVSAISLVHNWDDYFEDHVRGHHSRKVFTTTAADPDAAFLIELGLTPDLPLPVLRRRLRLLAISPRFHWLFLKARLHTNFVSAPPHRVAMAAISVGAVEVCTLLMPPAVAVVLVLLPMFPLYHVSALLQFVSEHDWLITEGAPVDSVDYTRRTRGRFCLEPQPPAGLRGLRRLRAWLRWAVRTVLISVPSRFAVLVGDLPAHDLHHLYPQIHDWTRSLWLRQELIDQGDRYGMRGREYASLSAAVNSVLRGISGRSARLSLT